MLYLIIYLALIESSQCRGVANLDMLCCLLLYNGYCYDFVFWYLHVCINVGATTTYDDIYTVYRNVSRSTREHKRSTTSQCVNSRIAPFSWPLGECHGVT
jgi:hypothetical protein